MSLQHSRRNALGRRLSLALTLALGLALVLVRAAPLSAEDDVMDLAARQAQQEVPAPLVRLSAARLMDLRAALKEFDREGGARVSRERAVLLYHIGQESADYGTMGEAMDLFSTLLAEHPKDAELMAYLGSAYTLRARDFPLRGLFMLLPGPGYVRIFDTGKGIAILKDAVALDPQQPVVRLIRGISFTKMPRSFGQFATGLADLELLRSRIDRPAGGTPVGGVIADRAFRADVLLQLAEAYRRDNNLSRSRDLFQRAAAVAAPGSPVAVAARAMATWTPQ